MHSLAAAALVVLRAAAQSRADVDASRVDPRLVDPARTGGVTASPLFDAARGPNQWRPDPHTHAHARFHGHGRHWGAHACSHKEHVDGSPRDHKDESWRPARCAAAAPKKFLVMAKAHHGASAVVEALHAHPELCVGHELLAPEWKDPCAASAPVGDKNWVSGGLCHATMGPLMGEAIDAVLTNAKTWPPPKDPALAQDAEKLDLESEAALAYLEKTWWPRWDQFRLCGHERCCARGFQWAHATQGTLGMDTTQGLAAWAETVDVNFVVVKRRDALALASRWYHDVLHDHPGTTPVTADLERVRAHCREAHEAVDTPERILQDVPAERRFDVAIEDLSGPGAEAEWARLLAFVGATDTISSSPLRWQPPRSHHFLNEADVLAVLREEGCATY
mmetsp:Transcript_13513/g.40263  ORF Transcript_13513/g.40263 Transcript_13513/m.40263 type:complete len:392 (-) Transcript_13513:86-1261(-)